MIWIIVLAVIGFFLYLGIKGGKDIKNVEKYGGLDNKYKTLVNKMLYHSQKLKMKKINSNNLEIGYSFTGGFVRFKLIEMNKRLQVRYMANSVIDGKSNIVWKFNEYEDQNEMFAKISKDLAIHTFMLEGLSREEAVKVYDKIYGNGSEKSENGSEILYVNFDL